MSDQILSVAAGSGLTSLEAEVRLRRDGPNELPRRESRTPLRIVVEVLKEPMLLLLLCGGAIYLAIGDLKEALILLVFATMSVTITVVQEARTERVLEALRDLTSPRALVIRDGVRRRIPGREVVVGDTLLLVEGDRVPADALLRSSHDLLADESLLTGESVPVRKSNFRPATTTAPGLGAASAGHPYKPGGDGLPIVFSGTLIVRGEGVAEVVSTGTSTEIGKIGASLAAVDMEPPRLQLETRRLVWVFASIGFTVSIAVVLLYGFLRGGWIEALLAGIALGMSMLPEEFPVVLTVFMAMGAWRISQVNVLMRRAAAIESLGAATVLCTDKTGTLTENRMTVAELRLPDGNVYRPGAESEPSPATMPENFRELAVLGFLASASDAVDPMDQALTGLAAGLPEIAQASSDRNLVRAYGLRAGLLAVANVWRMGPDEEDFVVAAKGAPEAIGRLCRLDDAGLAELERSVVEMAGRGLRVLAVARATTSPDGITASHRDYEFELVGLTGLADPLRRSVPAAVRECRSAGVRVVMITGDYPATAAAIAAQAGLDAGDVVTGDAIEAMSSTELARCVASTTVFARIMPAQKLRIVEALKANGEIVAMTGDGVNDAPSLKAAHVGVAMGGRGTDVAREASSIVLLDDDFGSIVTAIRLGRRIYDNLRKSMCFILAVHVPIACLVLLSLLLGLPIILGPVHIAFLEMVIDPVCSLVFEAEPDETDVMRRPPRPPEEALLSRSLVVWSLLQGAIAFAVVAVVFFGALYQEMPEAEVRAIVVFSLVSAIVGLIFVNRSYSASVILAVSQPNRTLGYVLGAVTVILALTLLAPPVRDLFHFGPLHPVDFAVTLLAGGAVLFVLEALKAPFAGRTNNLPPPPATT